MGNRNSGMSVEQALHCARIVADQLAGADPMSLLCPAKTLGNGKFGPLTAIKGGSERAGYEPFFFRPLNRRKAIFRPLRYRKQFGLL
jgi:hypothetical protein